MKQFINARSEREIVFVRGATEAINLVMNSYARPRMKAGDEILISALEHHSNIVPWQLLAEQTGSRLVVAPINDAGELILEEFERRLVPKTALVKAYRCCSMARRQSHTDAWTFASWTAISMYFPGIRCSGRPGLGFSMAAIICSSRCRRTKEAAT